MRLAALVQAAGTEPVMGIGVVEFGRRQGLLAVAGGDQDTSIRQQRCGMPEAALVHGVGR
ncbi:hypothetical protein D3C81_1659000 [compost metagenome]